MKKWFLLCGVCLLLSACHTAPTVTSPPTTQPSTTVETTVETTAETTQAPTVPREFGYDGAYRTCLTEETLLGIDVSSFQKEIDWAQVKEAGIEFVMIRVGFRGYGEKGGLVEDKYAQVNYQGAKEAGLKVGGYFFSQSTTPAEAVEEADFVKQLTADWEPDLPFGFDWECHTEEYRTANVDARTLTDCTKAFCEAMGGNVILYANPAQSPKEMLWEEVSQYGLWLGDYAESPENPEKLTMWQYTNEGKVSGIQGNVDINLYFPQ